MVPLLCCCSLNGRRFENYYPQRTRSNILQANAISFPTYKETDFNKCFVVKIMIANLYFHTDYRNPNEVYGEEGARHESIVISLKTDDRIIATYNVDPVEYALEKNGILLDSIKSATASSFKLVYPFNLVELFTSDFQNSIYFTILYSYAYSDTHQGSQYFSFHLNKTESSIALSKYSFSFGVK